MSKRKDNKRNALGIALVINRSNERMLLEVKSQYNCKKN